MAGVVVFLVAMPLCLGVALASGAPPLAGIVAGIVGGILVGLLSGSHTSVSGPAAGLTAVVASQIVGLGSFDAFLLAVVMAGLIQVGLGLAKAGFLAAFVPSSVIKGLLAAIGVILVLKQIPHVLGHHADPEGDLAFEQQDGETTFTELVRAIAELHSGAAAVGLLSVTILVLWGRTPRLKNSPIPAPLVVVLLGVVLGEALQRVGGQWAISPTHLVRLPVPSDLAGFLGFLRLPDFDQWRNPAVYAAAVTLAAVASLETLLNLEAADKLDAQQRTSPPSRELIAQGIGNVASGLVGGLPVTSVVVRSSVNVAAGAQTRMATVVHGVLLLLSVSLLGAWLNRIPLACLAAVLLVTGAKLASPTLVRRMWAMGKHQFIPFISTVVAIVLTDLLVGILIGLTVSGGFVLWSSARRPIRRIVENHMGGKVIRVELANQVTFLNRAALSLVLDGVPKGGRVLLDARGCDYIDPDVLHLIRDFQETTGPARGVEVSLLGFRKVYDLEDQILFVDYATREVQESLTPAAVLNMLREGNERFRTGHRLTRDLAWEDAAQSNVQHPLAVVVSCIDSRAPAELVFDLGVGDVLSVRLAGNVTTRDVLGSVEYGCIVAGAKLVLVMGHTRCGAIAAAVNLTSLSESDAPVCPHLDHIIHEILEALPPADGSTSVAHQEAAINAAARSNVARSVNRLCAESPVLDRMVRTGRIAIVGAMYDVGTRTVELLPEAGRAEGSSA